MSYREISMLEIKEVLRRKEAGDSARKIAREMGSDRKTVSRYLAAIQAAGIGDAQVVDDAVLAALAHAVQQRPDVAPSPEGTKLQAQRAQLQAWLAQKPPLRLVRVHELLARQGVTVGYTTLRRFVQRELGWKQRPATVLLADTPPGQEAQADFGQMGLVTDAQGRRRKLHVLVLTLSYSRYQFIYPTFEQTTQMVCEALDAGWRFFDGVVQRLVPDNASSMVLRASPTEPQLNRVFREYAEARGLLIDPARVRKPQDKGRVENQVAYIRRALVCRRAIPRRARGDSPARRGLVQTSGRHAGARHDAAGAATDVPGRGEAAYAARADGALRAAAVVHGQGARRPSRPGAQGAVLAADPVHRPHSAGAQRQTYGADLPGHGAAQGARTPAARGSLDGPQ